MEEVPTDGEGHGTFAIDAAALAAIDLIDVVPDARADMVDVSALLDSLLGREVSLIAPASSLGTGGTSGAEYGAVVAASALDGAAGLHMAITILYEDDTPLT